jgi:HSP20 family protein
VRELEEVSDRLNRLFARQESQEPDGKETMTTAEGVPSVDISESDEAFHIEADLPDVKKEDLNVTVDKGVLTLHGERKGKRENKDRKIHRTEREHGRFVRSFALPNLVDAGTVRAEFRNGVLQLLLPKSEKAKPKIIDIQVG